MCKHCELRSNSTKAMRGESVSIRNDNIIIGIYVGLILVGITFLAVLS